MKRIKARLVIMVLGVVLMNASMFFPQIGTANAATISPPSNPSAASVSACNSSESGSSPAIAACEIGYIAAAAGKTESDACSPLGDGSSRGATVGTKVECEAGFTDYNSNKAGTISPPSNPSAASVSACNSSESGSSPAIAACEIGYIAAAAGKTESDACSPLGDGSSRGATVGTQSECDDGFTDYNLAKSESADCPTSKYSGSQQAACIFGYAQGNDNKADGCSAKYTDASDVSACEAGYTSGGGQSSPSTPASVATTPTCEASGFSLSWILCPIFDLFSDASHFILNSIVEPFLITQPISTNSSDPTYQIWSNFRIYGDIFLVIALLVVVFGESIGGGLVDAYTARKVLPRLLTAAILINLSIYIVAIMVDATNVIGKGVGDLLAAPLTNCTAGTGNCWDFSLSNTDIASVFGVGLIGFIASSTAVVGALGALFFGGALAATTAITAAFFVVLPMIFAVIAVFFTLIFRKGLILFLILVSPVAFALYTLPNTEKYFKKWWDLLLEALMIYPIIVAIFGVADILSVTILRANSIAPSSFTGHADFDLGRTLALVSAFLLQFLPLLAIPFSFRFASGALGRIYDSATNAGGQVHKMATGRREQAKMDFRAQSNQSRGRLYNAGFKQSNKFADDPNANGVSRAGRFVARKGLRYGAKKAGGYNIEAIQSAARGEKTKQINDQIATGVDTEVRALSVDKAKALKGNGLKWDKDTKTGYIMNPDGSQGREATEAEMDKADYRLNSDGTREFQSMGGAWVDDASVDRAQGRWGRDQYAQQAALSYEMRKASKSGQRARIQDKYMDVATGSWGMSKGEAKGVWMGSSFENQNSNLQNKYFDPETKSFDHKGFVSEVYEKRSSYAMSQMDADSINRLTEAYSDGSATPESRAQLKEVAKTMQDRMSAARNGETQVVPDGEDGEGGQQQGATLGAGHVSKAMDEFVRTALPARENGDSNQDRLF